MKVLVTGSSGRIGRAIHLRLLGEHEVVGWDRTPSATASLVGDLGDRSLLERALGGVEAVVHAAALHAPHVGRVPDEEFERVNVQATRALVEATMRAGVRRFVFTSTTALYGAASTPVTAAGWVDEALAPRPKTIYHRTKIAAEALLEEASRAGSLAITALRMSRCFPEPAHLMAAYRLHRGVDARDVAEAHALALGLAQPGFRRFVISGATPFRPDDVHALKRDAPAVLERRAPDLVAAFARRGWTLPASIDRVYSPALAMEELGWKPMHGFDAVLKELDEGSGEVLAAREPLEC